MIIIPDAALGATDFKIFEFYTNSLEEKRLRKINKIVTQPIINNMVLSDIPMYLYRALREEEIKKGNILIPKANDPFEYEATFPVRFPIEFGTSYKHAIDNHQRFNGQFKTRGVSTSTELEIAKQYAEINKIIVKIKTEKFRDLGIKCYLVGDELHENYISKIEDKEIILVYEKDGSFPPEIIDQIITI